MEDFEEIDLMELQHEFGEEYYRILKMNFFDINELPNTWRD